MSDNSAAEGAKNTSLGGMPKADQDLGEKPLTPGEVLKQHIMDSGQQLDKPEQMTQPSDSVERKDTIDESPVEGAKEELAKESNPQDSVERKDTIDESPLERSKEEPTKSSNSQDSEGTKLDVDSSGTKVDNVDSSQSESQVSKAPDIAPRKTSAKLKGGE